MVDYIYVKIYDTLRTLKVMLAESERMQTFHPIYCRAVDVIADIYDFLSARNTKAESG